MRLTYWFLVFMSIAFFMSVSGCRTGTELPVEIRHIPVLHKPLVCNNKPIIVAVIDTGFGLTTVDIKARLCNFGHKDFTGGSTTDKYGTKDPVPVDDNGHGTHIAGLIDSFASKSNVNYCLVILKYYKPDAYDEANLRNTVDAINYAKNIPADYI